MAARSLRSLSEAPNGQLTDLFFLVLCQDDRTHLQVLARLSRMFQREGFLDRLRQIDEPKEAYIAIKERKRKCLANHRLRPDVPC